MRSDLKKHVQACLNCLRYNITQEGFYPLQSIEADQPWDYIEIDLIGPLPISTEGYTYILTVVDVFTTYTVIHALHNKSMEK